jgi:hypothetical protein
MVVIIYDLLDEYSQCFEMHIGQIRTQTTIELPESQLFLTICKYTLARMFNQKGQTDRKLSMNTN